MLAGIIIHCSDSPHGRGDDASTIDRWHRERGFNGIGYHFVILEDGTIQRGRDITKYGAHTKGYNGYFGICLIGEDYFTPEQLLSLSILTKGLQEEYSIDSSDILGHNEVSSKTCPNMNIQIWKVENGIL